MRAFIRVHHPSSPDIGQIVDALMHKRIPFELQYPVGTMWRDVLFTFADEDTDDYHRALHDAFPKTRQTKRRPKAE
jgi:hypothetical protein